MKCIVTILFVVLISLPIYAVNSRTTHSTIWTIWSSSAEFSPDRKYIAYGTKQKERREIRITRTKGESWFLDYGSAPHWKSSADFWNPYGTDPRSK